MDNQEGTKAPQAAGKIHTDFERGFIRAEVVTYDDLMACGSHAAAKKKVLYVWKEKNMWLRRRYHAVPFQRLTDIGI